MIMMNADDVNDTAKVITMEETVAEKIERCGCLSRKSMTRVLHMLQYTPLVYTVYYVCIATEMNIFCSL